MFRIVRVGVRMTGMPAFGPEHSDDDIWNIVAFVRQIEPESKGDHGTRHHHEENKQ